MPVLKGGLGLPKWMVLFSPLDMSILMKIICYHNPKAAATVVLLTGGIGLSDSFYLHFERFAKNFSVLTFDYQILMGFKML